MIDRRTLLLGAGGAALAPVSVRRASAQAFPSAPVRIIVAQAAGGSLDVLLRLVADQLGRIWGHQVVVLNMPTGSGVVAARTLAGAAPDGLTLFMAGASTYTVMPETQTNLNFDVSDFVPIGLVGEQPMAFAVNPSLSVNSLTELIALSKREPGGLNCAVGGRNSLAHLTVELLRARGGASLTPIYYPGASQALNDVTAGRVPVLVNILAGMAGAIANRQVKLLTITSNQRLSNFPDVPVASESVPDFNVSGWAALVAPRGTPDSIVRKINEDLLAVQALAPVQDRLLAIGVYTRSMSPQQVTEFIRKEQQVWHPLVREIGINTK